MCAGMEVRGWSQKQSSTILQLICIEVEFLIEPQAPHFDYSAWTVCSDDAVSPMNLGYKYVAMHI